LFYHFTVGVYFHPDKPMAFLSLEGEIRVWRNIQAVSFFYLIEDKGPRFMSNNGRLPVIHKMAGAETHGKRQYPADMHTVWHPGGFIHALSITSTQENF
jgi:hypothetical protein